MPPYGVVSWERKATLSLDSFNPPFKFIQCFNPYEFMGKFYGDIEFYGVIWFRDTKGRSFAKGSKKEEALVMKIKMRQHVLKRKRKRERLVAMCK